MWNVLQDAYDLSDVPADKLAHHRSLVENATYRYKTIIGRCMRSRTLGQRVEMRIACKILNTMTCLGMPDSYRAA